MSIITRMRKQVAVYWAQLPADDMGRLRYAAPVEITCRWDDEAREYVNALGERAVSKAVIYVDRDMQTGDKLLLGSMEQDTDSTETGTDVFDASPDNHVGVVTIAGWAKNPNLKATEFLRTAYA